MSRSTTTQAARSIRGATALVVMGVSGCGKSSVGQRLASELGWAFVEGDALHPVENVRKMAGGNPLTDADRWPWLDAVGHAMRDAPGPGVVASCSALRRVYRERLESAAGSRIGFVLLDGGLELIAARLKAREHHFMPATLLRSQFETLERPASDECALRVDISDTVERVVGTVVATVQGETGAPGAGDA